MSKEEIEKAKKKKKKWIYNMKTGRRVKIIHKGDVDFCNDLETLLQYTEQLEQENSKKDKIIDEMVETLVGLTVWDSEKDEPFILGDKEEVKGYFEKKVEDN